MHASIRNLLLALVFCGALANPVSPAQAGDAYLSLARDIPLPQGLYEYEDAALMFDKPEGRIVRMLAALEAGRGDFPRIQAFYERALPNLGWLADEGAFHREGDRLTIMLAPNGGENKGENAVVVFEIIPAK